MKKKIDFKDGFTRILIVWSVFFLGLGIFQFYSKFVINIFAPFVGGKLISGGYLGLTIHPDTQLAAVFYIMIGLIPVFLISLNGFVDLIKRIYAWFGLGTSLIIILVNLSLEVTIFVPVGIIIFGFILFKVLDFIREGFIKD